MQKPKPAKRRSNRFIDTKVQWALVQRLMMHWALMVLGLVCMGVLIRLSLGPTPTTFIGAIRETFGKQAPTLALMFVLVPVYLQDIVHLSHKFAGPMFRFKEILRGLGSGGKGARMKFRPGDFWQDIADDFNLFYERHLKVVAQCKQLERENRALRKRMAEMKKRAELKQAVEQPATT